MKKLLIFLIILSFITIGSILKFKKSNNTLRQPVGIPDTLTIQDQQAEKKVLIQQNEVTLGEWNKCYNDNYNSLMDPCQIEDGYQNTVSQFLSATEFTKCKSFYGFKINYSYSNPDLPLNYYNWYEDCFLNSTVQSIVDSNRCFKNSYYNILYIKCAGLPLPADIPKEDDLTKATLGEWNKCFNDNYNSLMDPCQIEDGYQNTVSQFLSATEFTKCKSFNGYNLYYSYSNPDLPLNYYNWYEDCFLNSTVQSIVDSNRCFKNSYYNILYVKCAGLPLPADFPKEDDLTKATLGEWNKCFNDNYYSLMDPCQTEEGYQNTVSQFLRATEYTQCKSFNGYNLYYSQSNPDLPLNYYNWYEDCFLNSTVQSIVDSNRCFKNSYYNILYIKCGGL